MHRIVQKSIVASVVAPLTAMAAAGLYATAGLDFKAPNMPLARPQIALIGTDGKVIGRIGNRKLKPLQAAEVPDYMIDSVIALEDRRFREHWGISIGGIGRAAKRNLFCLCLREGGSTIAQQTIKMSYLDNWPGIPRKIAEVPLSLVMTAKVPRDEIVRRYLSTAYYGQGQYGLRAASLHYFSKQPARLTLAESALLAAAFESTGKVRFWQES